MFPDERFARATRNRWVSRYVPEPITCSRGIYDEHHFCAKAVRISTGFDTRSTIVSDLSGKSASRILLRMTALRLTRFVRGSSGRCLAPAVMMMISHEFMSFIGTASTMVPVTKASSCRSRATPSHMSWLISVILMLCAMFLWMRELAIALPTLPAPMIPTLGDVLARARIRVRRTCL